ncbi:MAG: 5-formyltetrahydrofolate cyclo-ligase [Acidimicrobiales bacterium]
MSDKATEMGDVSSIRQSKQTARSKIAAADQADHAERVATRAHSIAALRVANTVAAYLAMPGELDPKATLARLTTKIYMPVIGPQFTMAFRLFSSGFPVVRNSFGTDEPPANAPSVAAEDLDVVLVPLVAFDYRGFRIGMGAGYYDRAFEFRKVTAQPPLLVGIAHSVQHVPLVSEQRWDVPLDYVVTETDLHGPFPQQ